MSFLNLKEEEPRTTEESQKEALALTLIEQKSSTILAFSALSILFCCIGGLIATYFAYQARKDAQDGNVMGAEHNLKLATGWMIAAWVLGLLSLLGKLSANR